MEFPTEVHEHVQDGTSRAAALAWWNNLSGKASKEAVALRRNIEQTKLFTAGDVHGDHITGFADAVAAGEEEDCVKRAADAIERSKRMVHCGPPSCAFRSPACSLVAFTSFIKRHMDQVRRPLASPVDQERLLEDLGDPETYKEVGDPSKEYRGQLPCRFWTALADVDQLSTRGSVSASRLREYLGLGRDGKEALLIAIDDSYEPTLTVPTGWDGFDNEYFRENSDAATDGDDHYGYTVDLATGSIGAREAVSAPVKFSATRLVRMYA